MHLPASSEFTMNDEVSNMYSFSGGIQEPLDDYWNFGNVAPLMPMTDISSLVEDMDLDTMIQ